MIKKKKVVIIGGGIAGLTAAYLFSKENNYEVHVVEKSNHLGGLLNSFDYGKEYGRFDYGAHNVLELQIKELDDFYLNLFPEGQWQKTTTKNGQIRALSGLMYNKKLQENMPFIDLRNNEKLDTFIGDFFINLNKEKKIKENTTHKNAYEFACYQFGQKITDDVIVPAIRKVHKSHPKDLSIMVMYLTQLYRVGLFEEHLMEELVHLKNIGSRLSYTEQLKLPKNYQYNLYSLYPKEFGIYRLIDAIENKLKENKVVIHKESTISNIVLNDKTVESISINGEENEPVDILVNSAGYGVLLPLLNHDMTQYSFDKHPKTIITNILLDKPLNCGELCFINNYEKGSDIFRIDNYMNYCSNAKRNGMYPISIETIAFDDKSDEELQSNIINELQEYNMITKDTSVKFIKTETLAYGFPCLSLNNINNINKMKSSIDSLNIDNLTNIGILTESNLFFESDVIKNAYYKIKELNSKYK